MFVPKFGIQVFDISSNILLFDQFVPDSNKESCIWSFDHGGAD